MIPRTLSATSLQVAALCMDRWNAEYMDRAPGFSNSAADVGSSVHGALEKLVKAVYIDKTHADLDRVRQKELLITFYQMSYIETFGTADMDTEEYKDGFSLCMDWFSRTSFDGFTVESAELKETIHVPYNKPDGSGQAEVPFNYIMDRVDKIGETEWRVVDYKSVRAPIQPDELETKLQARAYSLAIQIKHPECTKVTVVFDLLRHQPIGLSFTRDDNIAFWRFLCEETQRIVNMDKKDIRPTLNMECGYCVKKFTCLLFAKNVDAGGIMSLSIDEKAQLHADLTAKVKAEKIMVDQLEEDLLRYAAKSESLQWETGDGALEVEVGMTGARREFDAQRAAEIMGPELFAQMGNMTLGNLDKIIKDASIDKEIRDGLANLITKGNGNLKVFVKPKKKVF